MTKINVKISPAFVTKFPKEYLEQTNLSYSAALNERTKSIDLGLTVEEIKLLFPLIINENPDSPNFYSKVREYSADLSWAIPTEGKIINVVVDDNGMPDNILEYILYKTLMADAIVAKKEEDLKFVDGKVYRYKLEDIQEVENKEVKNHENLNKAVLYYAKLAKQETTDLSMLPLIKQILVVNSSSECLNLTHDEIAEYTKTKAEIKLKMLLDKFPSRLISSYESREKLSILAMIELGLSYNLLTSEGDSIFFDSQRVASSKAGLYDVLRTQSDIYAKLQAKVRAATFAANKIVPEVVEAKVQ